MNLSKIEHPRQRLREAVFTYQKPISGNREADEGKRSEWLRTVVPKIRKTLRKHRAVDYFQVEREQNLSDFGIRRWL